MSEGRCTPCCDYCVFYVDRGIHEGGKFAGYGTCARDGSEVSAADFCEEDFRCAVCSGIIVTNSQ